MDKAWKIFRSESGICSLENRELEERSFYRMKVFLKNFYRDQYMEEKKEEGHPSFLYAFAMNLWGKDARQQKEMSLEEQINELKFYISGKKFLLTWDAVLGLVITAADQMGNDTITSLEDVLVKEENWF